MKKFLLSFFIFYFCSCNKIFVAETRLFIERDDQQGDSSVVRFTSKKPLSGVLSREHYLVKAYFQEEGSNLELFSHFKGFELRDGVKVQFERQGNRLTIKTSVYGYPHKVLFEKEDYFLNSNEVDFSVEVENGTNYGFRIRIWENFINKSGILKSQTEALTGENLIADSLAKGLTFYTKGKGLKWGIQLFRARLIEGARTSPMVL